MRAAKEALAPLEGPVIHAGLAFKGHHLDSHHGVRPAEQYREEVWGLAFRISDDKNAPKALKPLLRVGAKLALKRDNPKNPSLGLNKARHFIVELRHADHDVVVIASRKNDSADA